MAVMFIALSTYPISWQETPHRTICPQRCSTATVTEDVVVAAQAVDVAIAGGGLAGLVTAAAVRRACPGVSVKVGFLASHASCSVFDVLLG